MTARSREQSPAYLAARRWKLGHQVFHIQLVALKTILEETTWDLSEQRLPEFSRHLRRLCGLLDAATATMVYTSSFAPEHYRRLIRPSMRPPFVSPGFSGLLNLEHQAMLHTLRGLWAKVVELLGQRREQWPEEVQQGLGELQAAIQRNRDNHGRICGRFVVNGVSLLGEFFAARHEQVSGHGGSVLEKSAS